MSSKPRVVAVVVTYNRSAMLAQCLAALFAQAVLPAEVVVVDNASTDGTRELVGAAAAPGGCDLRYLRLARNGGGAEGFHFGLRDALQRPCDWLWLMDDDAEPASDCLERLL